MSTISKEAAVGQWKDLTKAGLRSFVEQEMKRVHGQGWQSKSGCQVVAGAPNWDLQALLKTILLNWPSVFEKALPPSARTLVFELKDWRNHVSHEYDTSLEDIARLLDTSARLLKQVGAHQTAEVEALRKAVLRAATINESGHPPAPTTLLSPTSRIATRRFLIPSKSTVVDDTCAPPWQPCVARIGTKLGTEFRRKSGRCAFSPDGNYGVCCLVSKEYPGIRYWWTLHERQLIDLTAARSAFVAFACGSPDSILLIPAEDLQPWLPCLNPKTTNDDVGWHIHIVNELGNWFLLHKGRGKHVEITKYVI